MDEPPRLPVGVLSVATSPLALALIDCAVTTKATLRSSSPKRELDGRALANKPDSVFPLGPHLVFVSISKSRSLSTTIHPL